jgi:hypothetical protein
MLAHYLQLISTKTRFQMFDYGKRQNLERYHSEVPPLYPIENVSVPVYLVSSVHDSMTTLKVRFSFSNYVILSYFLISGCRFAI